MLRKMFYGFFAVCVSLASVSCASIVSGRSQQVPVVTNPSGATVTVGTMTQASPATFLLDRRQGVYVVKVEKEGYQPIEIVLRKGVNGWVWGNLIFGGLIGLVIDISSGSASKFTPDEVEVNLVQQQVGLKGGNWRDKDLLFVKLVEK